MTACRHRLNRAATRSRFRPGPNPGRRGRRRSQRPVLARSEGRCLYRWRNRRPGRVECRGHSRRSPRWERAAALRRTGTLRRPLIGTLRLRQPSVTRRQIGTRTRWRKRSVRRQRSERPQRSGKRRPSAMSPRWRQPGTPQRIGMPQRSGKPRPPSGTRRLTGPPARTPAPPGSPRRQLRPAPRCSCRHSARASWWRSHAARSAPSGRPRFAAAEVPRRPARRRRRRPESRTGACAGRPTPVRRQSSREVSRRMNNDNPR